MTLSRVLSPTVPLALAGLGLPLAFLPSVPAAQAAPAVTVATTPLADGPAMPKVLLDTLEWRCIGPARGGRVAAVAGVAGDRATYYMGATGGGVWKTTDAGRTWQCVSDGAFGGSIGAVAVAPSDPNVVYAGTGEQTLRGNVSSGDGLWKSTDAGKTWKFIGLADSHHVGRIRVHPKDPDLVYVTAIGHVSGPNQERGLYRSKDGGHTWQKVLYVSDRAGALDLCLDPTNPRILFATTWRVLRTPYSLESGGEGSGLWKSTDGGDSWQDISRKAGLPAGTLGKIGVAVSPADPARIWAMIEAEDGGLYRSDDGGDRWARVNEERNLRQRAWYYTRVFADTADRDVVYVLNVGFHRSKDGGRTFSSVSVPHGDNHDLWIDPHDPRRMVEGNDGGACVTFDGGLSWSPIDNQPTAQFYRVTTDSHVPYRVYGAQQDSSTLRIKSRSDRGRIGERDWEPTAGSESGHIAVHPEDSDIVFGGNYGGYLERVHHRTSERRNVTVWPDNPMGWGAAELRYRFQWNFPVFFSPHAPHALYAAGNVLFRSTNQGQSWDAISPDLTRNDKSKQGPSGGPITKDNTSVEYYCTIFAACESPLEKDLLWCGSDDGLVHVSADGGKVWRNVTPADWPEWMMVNCIEPHPSKKGAAYVAGTRYKLDDFAPYLYRTDDYGRTWTKITHGIGASHFTRAIRTDPARAGLLYAGTERGAYVSFDDGTRWQPLQLNLPITPITDLAVKDGDLIAATQGRSFWILDNLAHLHQLDARQASASAHLFAPEAVERMAGGFGGGGGTGANPPSGAVARFFLASAAKDTPATLEWIDADGKVIKKMTAQMTPQSGADPKADSGAVTDAGGGRGRGRGRSRDSDRFELKAGMNRLEWDLRHEPAKEVPGMITWGQTGLAARALPGRYQVRLTLGAGDQAIVQSKEFDVRKDPRSSATADDLRAQMAFLLEGRDKLTETHTAILRLRGLRDQVAAVTKKAEGEALAELRELGDKIRKDATAIEEALYQTKNRSNQDPLNYPIRLNDKLANLMSAVAAGDHRPTDQAHAVKALLVQAIDAELGKLEALESQDLAKLNRRAAEAGLPHVVLEK